MGFLKLLELENFKSYKGHMVVGPFKKFTAIIGPNGSGKSNLMDAISFVLGERTQNLRVKSLKDLIHGTPIGKPVSTRAKVSAVYREDDGTETTFTRIIIGSGSEYRLNGKVVPHSHYHSRLESVGVFIKAKNCLVFQGAVESIAMKTPKERTQLFEEISGSGEYAGEYDQKRLLMQQAQEETTMSYHKKRGITMEKKEARAEKDEAEKYKQMEEEYEEARIEEQLFNLYHSERRIKETTEQIKTKQKELDRLTNRRGKLDNQLKAKKQESAKWTRQVAILEKLIRENEVEINQAKPLYIKAKEKTSHVAKRLEANKKAHKKALEKEQHHSEQITSLEVELADVGRRAQQYEEDITEESQGDNYQLLDSQLTDYNKLRAKVSKKSATLTQQLERMELDKRTDEESLEAIKLKREELLSREKQLRELQAQHEQRVEKMNTYISTNTQSMKALQTTHEKLSNEVSQANLRYQEINDALEKAQNDLSEVRVVRQESSRRQKQAETLENLKRLYPGVYGKVIDLCEPVHSRYAVAITKVLARNIDGIIVDQDKTARDCIQYLKEQHSEPCLFIPLDTIEVRPINESLRELGGSTKLVYDVIRFEPPAVTRALMYACGNSLVCDTMEEARRMAFDGPERRRVVSLDGTLFQKSGVISGGISDIKAKAKAFDDKKVDGLKAKRDRLVNDLRDVVEVRRKEPELRNLLSQITGLEMRLKHSKRDKDITLEQTLPENQRELTVIDRQLQAIEPRMLDVQASIDSQSHDVAKLQSKVNKVEDEVFRDFCRTIGVSNIRQFEEKQLKGQQIRAQKRLEFSDLQSRLQNQLEFEKRKDPSAVVRKHARTIRDDESSIQALNEDERDKLAAIEGLEEKSKEIQEEKRLIKEEFDQKDVEINELRKMLNGEIRGITQLQKSINNLEIELDQRKADRHSLLKACKMEDIKIPMAQGSLDHIDDEGSSTASQYESIGSSTAMMDIDSISSQGARVWYERESKIVIDYSDLDRKLKQINEADEIQKVSQELGAKLVRLHTTLDRINAPNMRALEKLEGVEMRLQETSEVFEQARNLSKKTKTDFEKVKKIRLDKFFEALEHVTGEIDGIYKRLSNNGSAQAFISAENTEEPYLDGISYNCIAPGKRFRPMDNLSGGEKTVAALALLFAIHSYRSAPFFVLDEIDAALDNTNISRVANYITDKTTSGDFQCVVISLKEEFYCHADALIGIYSEVGGECTVSQTVTHDLTQYPITTSGTSPAKSRPQ